MKTPTVKQWALRAATALFLAAASGTGCSNGADAGVSAAPPADGEQAINTLESLRAEYGLASISVAALRNGAVRFTGAVGLEDLAEGDAATPDSIYMLASVSKPLVGLAVAKLLEEPELLAEGMDALDLDADVNDYLQWDTPLAHPDFPERPITLRQLLSHRSGLVSDADFDYDTYPKPDTDQPLDTFLREQLALEDAWLSTAPGDEEEYSNLGAALVGLIVERAAGVPFNEFCNQHLFTPLGMNDTRWHYRELSDAQRQRLARPHDDTGQGYQHYTFNDYPSGSLRSSARDMARLLLALTNADTRLGPEVIARFQDGAMFVDVDGNRFSHSGGEAGINTYFFYTRGGDGVVILINSDMDDDALDSVFDGILALFED